MDENFAYWSASFNEKENGSLRPSPLVLLVVADLIYRLTPLTCLACMITQDVSALPTSNPHGGPITHRSTGSKPDSPIHPIVEVIPRAWLRILFTGHLPNALFWYQTQILTLAALKPLLTLVQTSSNYLSTWNLLLYLRTLLLLYSICSTREIILCSFMG